LAREEGNPSWVNGELIFGVGRRDETYIRSGVGHLFEHLVMGTVGPVSLPHNAHVSPWTTTFQAAGPPEQVADFLRRVALAIAEPDFTLVDRERRILLAEQSANGGPGPTEGHYGERFGARHLGLLGANDPALFALTREDIVDWRDRWFVTANAILSFTGSVPSGLDVRLGNGPMPERDLDAPDLFGGRPEWADGPLAVSVRGPWSDEMVIGMRCVRTAVAQRLRFDLAIAYSPFVEMLALDGQESVFALATDCLPGHESVAATVLVEELRAAGRGIDADLLSGEVKKALAELLAPDVEGHDLSTAALDLLLDLDEPWTPSRSIDNLQAMTPDGVARALSEALPTLFLTVPEEEADPDQIPIPRREPQRLDPSTAVRAYRRSIGSDAPRGSRLIVHEDGLSLWLPYIERHARWDEVIGVIVDDGVHVVIGLDGWPLPVDASDWRGGGRVVDEVLRRVSPDLVVAADPSPEELAPLAGDSLRGASTH
jgi:hypothetical protein